MINCHYMKLRPQAELFREDRHGSRCGSRDSCVIIVNAIGAGGGAQKNLVVFGVAVMTTGNTARFSDSEILDYVPGNNRMRFSLVFETDSSSVFGVP
jgi:hypothetical protein